MIKRIFKYTVEVKTVGLTMIEMPKDSKIIKIAEQNEFIQVWAEVTNSHKTETVSLVMIETGDFLPNAIKLEYLETVLLLQGGYVLHIYKIVK